MKSCEISIHLNRHYTSFYTNFDTVQGWVEITPRKNALISKIDVSLEGYSQSTLPAEKHSHSISKTLYGGSKGSLLENPLLETSSSILDSSNTETHVLVKRSQKVISSNTSLLAKQTYKYPFKLMIPAEAKCCTEEDGENAFRIEPLGKRKTDIEHFCTLYGTQKVLRYSLPPSVIGERSFGMAYKVLYLLKVTTHELSRKIIQCKEINFRPREFSADLCLREKRCLQIIRHRSREIIKITRGKSKLRNSPQYSLEMRLYDSDILTPGQRPSFKLFVILKDDPEKYTDPIILDELQIDLIDSTKLMNRSIVSNDGVVCESSSRRLPLFRRDKTVVSLEKADENPDRKAPIKKGFIKRGGEYECEVPVLCRLPEDLVPLFRCCNVRRRHFLSVRWRTFESIDYGCIEFPVKILSGVSSIIEPSLIKENVNYTVEDVMDMAPKRESLPEYSAIMEGVAC